MATYEWLGTTDGDAEVSTNYSPNGVPTTGDTVTMDNDASRSISSGTLTADSIEINCDSTGYGITGGTINAPVTVYAGVLNGATFNASVTIDGYLAVITGGTFNDMVYGYNYSDIQGGTLGSAYVHTSNISGGTFSGTVTVGDSSTIYAGTFNGAVAQESSYIYFDLNGGTFNSTVTSEYYGSTLNDGTFNGKVTWAGTINNGTFNAELEILEGTYFYKGDLKNRLTLTGGYINVNAGTDMNYTFGDITKFKGGNSAVLTKEKGINGSPILGMI